MLWYRNRTMILHQYVIFLGRFTWSATVQGKNAEAKGREINESRKRGKKTMFQVATGNMVAVTATIPLRRKSRTHSDGLVPLYNAPYTRQFMRRNVLNTLLLPHYSRNLLGRALGSNHHTHRTYIKGNILNAVHLHCKYGCPRAILF